MQYVLVSVVILIVLVLIIGRIARSRNVPVYTESVEEQQYPDINQLKAQFFDLYYQLVIVLDHETRQEMFEIRDKRSKRILGYVDDQWQVQLYQQQANNKERQS